MWVQVWVRVHLVWVSGWVRGSFSVGSRVGYGSLRVVFGALRGLSEVGFGSESGFMVGYSDRAAWVVGGSS